MNLTQIRVNIATSWLYISLTHLAKSSKLFQNTLKSLTKIILWVNISVIMNTKCQSLLFASGCDNLYSWLLWCVTACSSKKKKKITPLKSINFHFKIPTKQILVIFWTKLEKTAIWQKSSATTLIAIYFQKVQTK